MKTYTLRFPPEAKVATIGTVTDSGNETGPGWDREADGSVIARYQRHVPLFQDWTLDELEVCMKVLEVSEQIRLSRQKEENKVVKQAVARFGAKKEMRMEGF